MGRGKKRKEDVGKMKGEWLRALKVKGGRGRENWTGLFLLNFKPTAGDTQNRVKWLYGITPNHCKVAAKTDCLLFVR
jgi:hypothetical protein